MNVIAMLMLAADPLSQPLPDVVLLDFTATYCPPCQQMVPVLQRMEHDRYPIRKIDISEHPEISRKYGVSRIPTMILMVDGKEAQRFVGITADEELRTAMNDAARKLDMERRDAGGTQLVQDESFDEFADRQPPKSKTEPVVAESKSGIQGFFDRVKRGFSGDEEKTRADAEAPDFRAQSPDTPRTVEADSLPMRATVRVRLADGKFHDVGTGTIVHSTEGQSTILTCAHMFKKVSASAKVEVEVFRNGEVLKYPAEVLGGDHDSDLAFLRIKNRSPLPMVPLLPSTLNAEPGQAVFSLGCNAGNLPTALSMKILKLNFFEGPENIVCSNDPIQGRSGGGLYNRTGELIGVCSGAFRKSKEGLYTGVGAVRKLISELKLGELFQPSSAAEFVTAERDSESDVTANPFLADDDYFEQMFTDGESAFAEEAGGETVPVVSESGFATGEAGRESADPFAAESQTEPSISRDSAATPEITVIIDDPATGKKVVVIPKPSRFLMQLLTGQSAPDVQTVSRKKASKISETSVRQSVRKPATYRPKSRRVAGQLLPVAN